MQVQAAGAPVHLPTLGGRLELYSNASFGRAEAPLPCLWLVQHGSIRDLGFSPLSEAELVLSRLRGR